MNASVQASKYPRGFDAALGRREEPWRAAAYLRLSRDDGIVGESDSIVGQRNIIYDWAERREDVSIVVEYVDDGYSGALFDRPAFERMMDDAQAGLFDTIVVKDLSRFGRSYLDCGSWIERHLPQLGVRLYSIDDGFDSMQEWDYNTALLLPMKNLINEMQVISTSEKVRTSLAAKRQRGQCVANFAPYGYTKDPLDRHRLVVDETAADVVRLIFAMFASGKSASSIARWLNAEGIESPSSHKRRLGINYRTGFQPGEDPLWHAKSVMRVLRDETYTGTLAQGKTRRPSWRLHEGLPVPQEMWQRSFGAHEAIVGHDLFARVQALIEEQGTGREKQGSSGELCGDKENDVLISGQYRCGGCGAPMRRIKVMSKGRAYAYYVCSAHKRNVRVCSPHSIREDELLSQLERGGAPGKGGRQFVVGEEGAVLALGASA